MGITQWVAPATKAGALALLTACGPTATSIPTVEPTVMVEDVATILPTATVVGIPVPRTDVGKVFAVPLASGLSVAEIVENASPSVVHIVTSSNTGTGFIVNEDGLVVTNAHVVESYDQVVVQSATGERYRGSVVEHHPRLDVAYVQVEANRNFSPIAIGDSNTVRVGDDVIAIGFPLGRALGQEPTVSVGIISAKRNDRLQTDASLNPGNSGGPLLDMFGQVVGVVVSRVETNRAGRPVAGIGFAIPINVAQAAFGGPSGQNIQALPVATPAQFPAIAPSTDVSATKSAIETIDAHRRQVELATRTATEARQEAARYASSLEATRIAELPTPTPTRTPTPSPLPTPTPHSRTFCQEWETLVLEWIKQGNNYVGYDDGEYYINLVNPDVPDHPQLSSADAPIWCRTEFPTSVLRSGIRRPVGDGPNQLLPGTYEYRRVGDKRVESNSCALKLNIHQDNWQDVDMLYGEPFTFRLHKYHGLVRLRGCGGALYGIED